MHYHYAKPASGGRALRIVAHGSQPAPSLELTTPRTPLESRMFLGAGGAGRGIPARRAGAFHVTDVLDAEDGWGNPATS